MRRVATLALIFGWLVLLSSDALAMPRFVYELSSSLRDLRPAHVFYAGCFFGVIFIFGIYQAWRAWITLGSIALAVFCVAVSLTWQLTGDVFRKRVVSPVVSTLPKTERPARAAPEVDGEALALVSGAGARCKATADCPRGTSCENVAGQKKCWQPCADSGGCPTSHACFPVAGGRRVCAR